MIVVTGSSGFVGGHVVAALIAAGHDVVGLDRRRPITASPASAVPVVLGDLAAPDRAVRRALRCATGVVHLAGRPGVRDTTPGIDRLRHRDNVVATASVVALTRPRVPLVMTSSSSVYGGSVDGRPCHEDQPLRPLGGYARSKAAAEVIATTRTGPTCVLRPFTVIGERQRDDMALTRWLRAAAAGRPIEVYGGLHRTRDLTDVRDVARLVVRALERHTDAVVNAGTGHAHTLRACVDAIALLIGDVHVVTVGTPTAEPDDTLADTTRCDDLLGLRPNTDLVAVVARQARSLGIDTVPGWSPPCGTAVPARTPYVPVPAAGS